MTANAQTGGPSGIAWRWIGWGAAAALLLVPLAARWPWTASDYVLAGAAFALVGGAFEVAVRMTPSPAYRAGAAVALLTALLLAWVNGAVGIIGSEDNPANLMYLGVIAVAIAGAAIAAFRATGMARAMAAAAIAQGLVTAAALAGGLGASEPAGWIGVLGLNLGFVLPWVLAWGLFRRAAMDG